MADITSEVVKLDARVAEINVELESLLQEHDVHAAAKTEAERRMIEINGKRLTLRKEREGLSKLRDSAAASQRIATAEEAAHKAKQEADNRNAEADLLLKRLADKEKALDEKLAAVSQPAEQA